MLGRNDKDDLTTATEALERADDFLMRGMTADAHEEIRRGLRDIGIAPVPDNPHLKVA